MYDPSLGKHQPPMQSIKESTVDLSYLKKVKSKVDCWTNRLSIVVKTEEQK